MFGVFTSVDARLCTRSRVKEFSVATRLFAFLFKVFVSRQFGASVVGVYQMALSFYFFASAVALSGLPTDDGNENSENACNP